MRTHPLRWKLWLVVTKRLVRMKTLSVSTNKYWCGVMSAVIAMTLLHSIRLWMHIIDSERCSKVLANQSARAAIFSNS